MVLYPEFNLLGPAVGKYETAPILGRLESTEGVPPNPE